jgi:hypothetical protein
LKYRTKTQEYEAHLISQARGEMAIRPYGSDGDYEIVAAEKFMAENDPVTESTPRGRDFRKDIKAKPERIAPTTDQGFGFKADGTPRLRRAKNSPPDAIHASVSNGHQAAPAPEHELVGSAAE